MKSMTGYGRAVVVEDSYKVEVQISSVNRRHNDLVVRFQKEYANLEPQVRNALTSKILRGQVTVTIFVERVGSETAAAIDFASIEREIAVLKKMSQQYKSSFSMEAALFEIWKNRGHLESREEELTVVHKILDKALVEALEAFNSKRELEGTHICDEFEQRIKTIRRIRASLKDLVAQQVETIREHLQKVLNEALPRLPCDDRLLREVVLYADRSDVSEELSRIDHHLEHMEKVLQEKSANGKLVEFILQELLREWNTLGSKTTISEASTAVILAKMEIEKMREQVQNVE